MSKKKWKINFSKWVTHVVNVCILYLMLPFICFTLLVEELNLNISADTFFAVFIVLFIIKIFYVVIYPPIIIEVEENE